MTMRITVNSVNGTELDPSGVNGIELTVSTVLGVDPSGISESTEIAVAAAETAVEAAERAEDALGTITDSSNIVIASNMIRTQTIVAHFHPLY